MAPDGLAPMRRARAFRTSAFVYSSSAGTQLGLKGQPANKKGRPASRCALLIEVSLIRYARTSSLTPTAILNRTVRMKKPRP